MISLLDRPDRSGLIANVAGALTIAVILNALIFGLRWDEPSQHAPAFLPLPIVIGMVWLALFTCMAFARWELNRATAERADKAGLVAVFALCSTYPFYTAGLNNDIVGEAANVTLMLLTGGLAARYASQSPRATAWLVPLVLWLTFASVAGAFKLAPFGK